jgi:Thiamine pyrophosphate enzyme, C-terminal TPP binding domain
MAANEWWAATEREDSFYMHGALGFAASFALGLALSLPQGKIWLINADGSLCMNLGCLLTEAAQAPKNLKHFVIDNGVYQTVGGLPMVNQGRTDYAAIARGAGFARARNRDARRDRPSDAGDRGRGRAIVHRAAGRAGNRLSAHAADDLRGPGDEVPLRPRAGEALRHQGFWATGVLNQFHHPPNARSMA